MLRPALIIGLFLAPTLFCVFPFTSQRAQTTTVVQRLTVTPEESLNLHPVISDDGKTVVFESTADLAQPSLSHSFQLFRTIISGELPAFEQLARSRAASPSLSGNGRVIAFASTEDLLGENSDRNSEIYLLDGPILSQLTHTTPSTEATRLTDGNFDPSISADGRLVAFSSNRYTTTSTNSEIFILDRIAGVTLQVSNSADAKASIKPKISADGTRLFYITRRGDYETLNDLLLYDTEAHSSRTLVENVAQLSLTTGHAVSADGNRIVYASQTGPSQSQVFLFDLRLNESRQLTQLGSRTTDVDLNPAISGDGKRVTFATRRRVTNASDGSVELYLLDIPTAKIEQLTNAPAVATAEVISSLNHDGSCVVFNFPRVISGGLSNSEFANDSEIYVASLSPRPLFGEAKVTNAANQTADATVAPASIAVLSGVNLSNRSKEATLLDGQLPFELGGTTVQVNGVAAQLIYVSSEEVIFVVPAILSNGPAECVVINSDGYPSRAAANISRTSPGVFSFDNRGVFIDATTFRAAPFDPTDGQLRLLVFATGVRNATQLSLMIGGQTVSVENVIASTFPGLDEIRIRLPEDLRGSGTVAASIIADGITSNLVSTSLSGSSLRDIMINEILADPPDGLAGDANRDGMRDSSADEFVELVNATTRDIDLGGYQLQTRAVNATAEILRHKFAAGTLLEAGTALVVFGGGNLAEDNSAFGGAKLLRASTGSLSLSNSGAVVTLRDTGSSVVTSITYGASTSLAGDANQSITRFPDVVGDLALHQGVPEGELRAFSPGTRVDGGSFSPSPAVAVVKITPANINAIPGSQFQFKADAFDELSREMTGILFRWNSSNVSVATVDQSGTVKAINPGQTEITVVGRRVQSTPALVMVSTPSASPSPTPLPTPTVTPSPTPDPSPGALPSPSPSPTGSPTPTPSLPPLLISEFRTRGPAGANDEFIEIYNSSDNPVNAGGLRIRGSSSSGTISTRLTIAVNTVIPAHGHFLAINAGAYSGTTTGDQSFTSGIANDGGIALIMPDDSIIDQAGLSTGSAFKEGMHLAPFPSDANQSYERKPGGPLGSTQDTNDNFSDFQLVMSSPQNLHSQPTPESSPLPTPSPLPSPSPTATASPSPEASPSPSPGPSINHVLISQVFGGGGNSGAPFRNDFIELFNAGSTAVNLSGWSVQYSSATASTWSVSALNSFMLEPGQYYLVQEASGGSNGLSLPTPDLTGTISMAATAGKVALVMKAGALSGSCPQDSDIVDLVGYGSAGCFEGVAAAPAPSNSMSIIRANLGCTDSDNNANDFSVAVPTPRNTGSPMHSCVNNGSTRAQSDGLLPYVVCLIIEALASRFL